MMVTYYYYYCYCSCQYQIGEDIPLCAWFKAVLRRLSQQDLFLTGPWWDSAVEASPTRVSNSKLTHANVLTLKMYSRQDNLAHDKLDKSQGIGAVAWSVKHALKSMFATALYANTAILNISLNKARQIL